MKVNDQEEATTVQESTEQKGNEAAAELLLVAKEQYQLLKSIESGLKRAVRSIELKRINDMVNSRAETMKAEKPKPRVEKRSGIRAICAICDEAHKTWNCSLLEAAQRRKIAEKTGICLNCTKRHSTPCKKPKHCDCSSDEKHNKAFCVLSS